MPERSGSGLQPRCRSVRLRLSPLTWSWCQRTAHRPAKAEEWVPRVVRSSATPPTGVRVERWPADPSRFPPTARSLRQPGGCSRGQGLWPPPRPEGGDMRPDRDNERRREAAQKRDFDAAWRRSRAARSKPASSETTMRRWRKQAYAPVSETGVLTDMWVRLPPDVRSCWCEEPGYFSGEGPHGPGFDSPDLARRVLSNSSPVCRWDDAGSFGRDVASQRSRTPASSCSRQTSIFVDALSRATSLTHTAGAGETPGRHMERVSDSRFAVGRWGLSPTFDALFSTKPSGSLAGTAGGSGCSRIHRRAQEPTSAAISMSRSSQPMPPCDVPVRTITMSRAGSMNRYWPSLPSARTDPSSTSHHW